jgi:PBS lyase HEAT-like repeat
VTKLSISAAACCCLLLVSAGTQGQVVYDLPKLIDTSDVVAVAQVEAVSQTGSGMVEIPGGRRVSAHFRVATLRVREVFKGARSSADISIRYTILYSPGGWAGGIPAGYTIRDTLTPNSTRIVFLKSVGDHYEFTNGSYLSIVCAQEAPSGAEPSDTFNRVLSRITDVLHSASTPQQEKAEAIWQLSAVRTDSIIPALRTFVQSDVAHKDEFLRTGALVALLEHKDESVVEAAASELLGGSAAYWKSNLLFAITRAVPPSRSMPIIAEVLTGSSAQMRASAAVAIYQTNSAAGIPLLLRALDDPDPEVTFAVMQGVGNLTQSYEWRPKSTEPDADWFRCLNHWREYRQRWNHGKL